MLQKKSELKPNIQTINQPRRARNNCAWLSNDCSFILKLSGAALLGLGIWLMVDKNVLSYIDIVTWDSSDPYLDVVAYVLIGTGSFIFLVGFCGCCGALRESRGLIALVSTPEFFVLNLILSDLPTLCLMFIINTCVQSWQV